MTRFLPRSGARASLVAVSLALAPSGGALAQAPANSADPTAQPAPAVSAAAPAAADEKLAARLVEASPRSRHLAPHDTFFLLSYVAVRTGKGVEGFNPGQEVHLVEVHRDARTLVVSDGHANVEVPPSKLTNDRDIAALVRRQDEASQAQLAAHLQTEQATYARYEREAADATAKDLAQRQEARQAQATAEQAQEQAPVAQTAQPTAADTTLGEDAGGYYGLGGYGYGSPYSYFTSPTVIVRTGAPAAAAKAPAPAAAPVAVPGAIIAPAGRPAGGARPK